MVSIRANTISTLTLLGFQGSSTSNRIRIALCVKGIPYHFQNIDIGAANVQRSDEWKATKNGLAQIPVLQVNLIDGSSVLLRQSVAINEFLEEAYPDTPRLLPEDTLQRAKVREIVEIVNSYIQPMQNKLTVEMIAKMDPELAEWMPKAIRHHTEGGSSDEKAPVLWPQRWIMNGFHVIEGLLDEHTKFCFGDHVTLADCALVPQVMGAKKYLVDLTPYPKIMKVYTNVLDLDSVKQGMTDVIEKV